MSLSVPHPAEAKPDSPGHPQSEMYGASLIYFMCMSVCLHVFVVTMCVPGAQGGQKKEVEPLELKLHSREAPCGCWEPKAGPLQE